MACIWRWLPERILKNGKLPYCLESLHTACCLESLHTAHGQESPCCQDQSGRLPPGADIRLGHIALGRDLNSYTFLLPTFICMFRPPMASPRVRERLSCTSVHRGPLYRSSSTTSRCPRRYGTSVHRRLWYVKIYPYTLFQESVPLSLEEVPRT